MISLDLVVIGNCGFGALIDRQARIIWACLPRFDGDPFFSALLSDHGEPENGFWSIELAELDSSEQRYRRNSAVLETVLRDAQGGAVRITDFAPRFRHYDRMFRPPTLVRKVERIAGTPRIRVRLRPTSEFGTARPAVTRGSNHMRFVTGHSVMRLTTDAPLTYVASEQPFALERPLHFLLGPDESLTASVAGTAQEFLTETERYWSDWARQLSIPFEWQEAVVRAAITLKLCSFDETGGILAAMTTSVPEAPGSGRNWDYRYCWLRDSFYTVHALNRLGATRTMEGFLSYIANIVAGWSGGDLQPVFGIGLETDLSERQVDSLAGYRGMGPVRIGNDAFRQAQNDGYGSVILASAQSFFDIRVGKPGDVSLFRLLERLGEEAARLWDAPDAGLWELRTRKSVHTYSSLLCWAGCDRLALIARQLGLEPEARRWGETAAGIKAGVLERAWNERRGAFVQTFGGEDADASLLLMPYLGFLDASDPRFAGTLAFIEQELKRGPYLFRYSAPDDFGSPDTAFNVCTFWYIDALAAVGRVEEARALFEDMLACRNHVGLLSEDLHPETRELWGNFPQTYSMVGIINSATRLSKSWEEAF
ncbi:pentatricopeptide repeat domain-containing protein (PPR motif) [Tistlia consotensis]|uniref:Pentatricopeptide repeat domain-containing protein (PPR motif) n=1 Tax=Tistlia consotensis USBA 355 TaxID=560819 RepID=A0A1Y6C780_9PROT|nr:glycoside hydrolase family 15 protein [Tistlia consotensis]SMF46775.1 pentatricopeptide repeat domain-containing protein (PPR motif) [Tistlia consotensis USBA 355]SNR78040.1 pentatricopeptide repeat domain-containing protein (PPR motif) [Tistlia consotensis]